MGRYYIVDTFRGIAAFGACIALWTLFSIQTERYPEDWSLFVFTAMNILASYIIKEVKLLSSFCISGFIFFMYYHEKISKKLISPFNFFLLRFSRLYPLHFVN